jgi:hypothetical protein
MADALVRVGDVTVEQPTLPRDFRNAWKLTGDVVSIDQDLARSIAIQHLRDKYRRVRDGGTMQTIGESSVLIATTLDARQEVEAMRDRLADSGGTQKAMTRSGVVVTWTADMAVAILSAIDAHIATATTNEATLAEKITSSDNPSEVDITTGWPE